MKRRLKINGVIIFCSFLLIAFFPKIFLRNEPPFSLDTIAEISGIAFILLGQILRVSARGYKAEYSAGGNVLIQGGPYALVRNPMYLGIFLIGVGIVAMLFKWWALSAFLIIFIIRYLLLIFKEEKKLEAVFPKDYPAYRQRVPRVFPSITMLLRKDITEYLPLKLIWLRKEIGPILAVLLITILLESWEEIKNRGLTGYLKEAAAITITIILFICLIVYLSKKTNGLKKDVPDKSKNQV
ncbi:MAG: isoprenylcysteine carboxylmethyltransferase family protein [Candidatus Omnitrophota bacterium]|jgi:protein-S-isoprenylcysteine O-methyltransferase Ste14